MLKIVENPVNVPISQQPTSTRTMQSAPTELNSSLSENVISVLTKNSSAIKTVCSELAAIIEDQVTNPNPQTGGEDGEVVSQRLLEWTADLFAIAADIDFYVNPPVSAD